MKESAKSALQFDSWGIVCKEIDYELIFGEDSDTEIFSFDKASDTIAIVPTITTTPGNYENNFLRFFYVEYPDIYMEV